MTADEIGSELGKRRPYTMLGFHWRIWRGLFSMHKLIEHLESLLPKDFSDLSRPFGVGLCTRDRKARIQSSGSLPEAVAASCAMPYIFAPVLIDGVPFCDGGTVDRVQIDGWKAKRPNRTQIVHIVDRSHGAETDSNLDGLTVIRTPRSGASFFGLGDFEKQIMEAKDRASKVLRSHST
jgi:NTE family protein